MSTGTETPISSKNAYMENKSEITLSLLSFSWAKAKLIQHEARFQPAKHKGYQWHKSRCFWQVLILVPSLRWRQLLGREVPEHGLRQVKVLEYCPGCNVFNTFRGGSRLMESFTRLHWRPLEAKKDQAMSVRILRVQVDINGLKNTTADFQRRIVPYWAS